MAKQPYGGPAIMINLGMVLIILGVLNDSAFLWIPGLITTIISGFLLFVIILLNFRKIHPDNPSVSRSDIPEKEELS